MRISLIVSTYNNEPLLQATLRSIRNLATSPDEILIADDGSGPATKAVIEDFAASISTPVVHVWHEDTGFRLSAIRNRAVARSTGDYLVFVDGDQILERHFISDHRTLASEKQFVLGNRVEMGPSWNKAVLEQEKNVRPRWWSSDISKNKDAVRSQWLCHKYSRPMKDHSHAIGSNMAGWRKDIIAVNGFDEIFEGWGSEDTDFAHRMRNAGNDCLHARHHALVFHIHHAEASREQSQTNEELLELTLRTGRTRCEKGIDQYLTKEQRSVA